MRVKNNEFLITAAHSGLKRLMEQLLGDYYRDADWIFWSNIRLMVDQSGMKEKRKCFEEIVTQITRRYAYRTHDVVVDYDEAGRFYNNHQDNYRFSGDSGRLGYRWGCFIREQDILRIDALQEWLREFREIMMPKVNEIIESYENKEPQLTEKELKDRKKKYRAYEKSLTDCQKLLEKSIDVIEFMKEDPRQHP